MENAHMCWTDSRGAVCIRRGSRVVFPWRCSDSLTVSSVARVSCSPRVYASVGEVTVPSLTVTQLSLLISARTGSMTVGGSSPQRCWGDSPTLFRSSRSTPADSEGEDLFIEAGARQKVCVFPRARPGKDALEWSDVQLATALTLTPSAVRWGKRREPDNSQCLHLLRYR